MIFYNRKKKIKVGTGDEIASCMEFIEHSLNDLGTNKNLLLKTLLLAEECAAQIIEHADDGAFLSVKVRKALGDAQVVISALGREYDPYDHADLLGNGLSEEEEDDVSEAARAILLKAHGESLKFSRSRGKNSVRILSGQAKKSGLFYTFAALFLGLLFGLLMSEVFPEAVSSGLSVYVLTPIKTCFMNALKIIIAPVVFFSIVSCISQFKDIAELGRIGAKVMGMYLFTTVIAVFLSMGIALLLHPGDFGFALQFAGTTENINIDTGVDTSLINTIVNIVPSNFIEPFLESDTLQLIFLAVICGMAVGMVGEYSAMLQGLFDALNSLFLTITAIISRLIPVAVFCSVALVMVEIGSDSLLSVLAMAGTQILAVFCMLAVYGLLILVLGRLNPITFFRKAWEGMLTSFTLSSSSAAMPTNMKVCTEKLGISPKISNFSIPLGATVNMDGTCIFLMVNGLFLARAYGVQIQSQTIATLVVTIILLSLGAPGVPGAAFVCLGIVLEVMNVPVDSIGIVLGIAPFLDMFDTMSNTTGDMAAALIVAKREGLLDIEKYRESEH